VGLAAHIRALGRGLASPLTRGGSALSAGECLLLGLARALLRRPRVLVLDEAAAAADPLTEARVSRLAAEHLAGATLVAIAHRLRSIADFDRVLVLGPGGTVLECDDPRVLAANPASAFAKLLAQQVAAPGAQSADHA
jgi:ATP-binding cassette subfamily C (CFTR/MRP) protein 3